MQAGPVAEDQKVEEEEIIEATEAWVLDNVGPGFTRLLIGLLAFLGSLKQPARPHQP